MAYTSDPNNFSLQAARAKRRGVAQFNPGEPCQHGHVSDRYTATRRCVECIRLRKARRRAAALVVLRDGPEA